MDYAYNETKASRSIGRRQHEFIKCGCCRSRRGVEILVADRLAYRLCGRCLKLHKNNREHFLAMWGAFRREAMPVDWLEELL